MHCIPPSLRAPRSSLQFPDGSDRHCAEDLLRRLSQGQRCRIAQCRVSSSDGPKPAAQWFLQTDDLMILGPWTYWQARTYYLKHLETKICKHNTCHWNSSRFSLRTQALKLHQVPSLPGELPKCKVVRCMILDLVDSRCFRSFSFSSDMHFRVPTSRKKGSHSSGVLSRHVELGPKQVITNPPLQGWHD